MSDSLNVTVKELKNGNKKTFKEVFNTYYRALCIYAEGIVGEKEAAADVVSDFFLKFWENHEKITVTVSLQAYLYKGVHNNCLKHLEHLKVWQRYREEAQYRIDNNDMFAGAGAYEDDPLTMLISQETVDRIEQAIDALPPQCKEVFEQVRMLGLSYQEAADKLGVSINTVRTQITRAMDKLRESLGNQRKQ